MLKILTMIHKKLIFGLLTVGFLSGCTTPTATKKNLNANAVKGSLLSIIGFVVIKADDHSRMNMNGYILIILGFIKKLRLHLILKFS